MTETQKRIQETKEIISKATPGPWSGEMFTEIMNSDFLRRVSGAEGTAFILDGGFVDDGHFIAHARNTMPLLVEALEKAVQDLTSITNGCGVWDGRAANLASACLVEIETILGGGK